MNKTAQANLKKAPVLRLSYDRGAQCRRSVVEELEWLHARALRGELVGLGVVTLSAGKRLEACVAGELAIDPLRAAGCFLRAAMKEAES